MNHQHLPNKLAATSASAASKKKTPSSSPTSTSSSSNNNSNSAAHDHQQPMFLRKTFNMLSNSPSEIVTWTERGDSFIVKNQKKFAETIIPQYFKHNNFSSFVRQLNFYGFRKVKPEMNLYDDSSKYIEFKHPQFQRGRPDLLHEMKRTLAAAPANNEAPSRAEYDELKHQVDYLNSKVDNLTSTIEELKNVIKMMMVSQQTQQPSNTSTSSGHSHTYDDEDPKSSSKRVRTNSTSPTVVFSKQEEEEMLWDEYNDDPMDQDTLDLLINDFDNSFVEEDFENVMLNNNNNINTSMPAQDVANVPVYVSGLAPAISTPFLVENKTFNNNSNSLANVKSAMDLNLEPSTLPLASAALGAFITNVHQTSQLAAAAMLMSVDQRSHHHHFPPFAAASKTTQLC